VSFVVQGFRHIIGTDEEHFDAEEEVVTSGTI
jgi:hypothetical protein